MSHSYFLWTTYSILVSIVRTLKKIRIEDIYKWSSARFVHIYSSTINLYRNTWFRFAVANFNNQDRYGSLQLWHKHLQYIFGISMGSVTFFQHISMAHGTQIYWIMCIGWRIFSGILQWDVSATVMTSVHWLENMFRNIAMRCIGHWTELCKLCYNYTNNKRYVSYCQLCIHTRWELNSMLHR
jgi:hypothetical protein